MALSRTWNSRLVLWRSRLRASVIVVVCTSALFGGAAGCKVFLAPDRPDIAGIAQRVGNQSDQIGAFASEFVVTWLTATATARPSLRRFITLPDDPLSLPTTPAAVVTTPQVVSVIHTGTVGDADVYAATVSVTERPYASADPVPAFYRVPVSMWNYQPRALTMPARINGPGPGADVPHRPTASPLSADSPVYAVVSGFIRDLPDRHRRPGPLRAGRRAGSPRSGGYQQRDRHDAATDRPVPDDAAPGTRVHVLATVVAQTSQFATVTLTYPLTVENSGGTWMVAGHRPDSRRSTTTPSRPGDVGTAN